MFFDRLRLNNWQQFDDIDLEFHPRLTILTGTNGSGKTTILNQLARHASWSHAVSLAVPKKNRNGAIQFFTRYFQGVNLDERKIGRLSYTNGSITDILVPQAGNAQYSIELLNQQSVRSLFIPSHKNVYRYEPVNYIPIGLQTKESAFNRVSHSSQQRYQGGSAQSASYHIKDTLIAWNVFGHGNVDMMPDPEQLKYYKGFENALRKILPETIGFDKLSIRNHEVILECKSGDFMIDAASGGLSALIDITWQIHMFAKNENDKFTIIIDEIENHLHPTMQRRILPDLLRAFPSASFIISTHSPLIISSSNEGHVYALRSVNNRIYSELLNFDTKAQTAIEILDEVLGVPTTIPIWAEKQLNEIVSHFLANTLSEQSFSELRRSLKQIGLDQYMPEALGQLLDKNDKDNTTTMP